MSGLVGLLIAAALATGTWVPAHRFLPSAVGPQEQGDEIIVEVRFRGNYSITDDTLLAAAAVEPGTPLTAATLEEIERRLRDTDGVGSVEILKRYRSMTSTRDIVLLVNVTEHESVVEKFMWLPLFTWTDEYGVSFGATFATIDLLGLDERLSFPLSWGGERRAAAQGAFDIDSRWLSRVDAEFGIMQRENPHFELPDRRVGGSIEAARRWQHFELNGSLTAENVEFDGDEGNRIEWGFGAVFDTRQDAQLPRDAVYLGAGFDQLVVFEEDRSINRLTVDLRGYKTFIGRTIIATQGYWRGADARLPDADRPFLGGAATVRGYDAGEFIGDNIALLSAEWRVPITPPLPVGLVGLNFFFDSGAVYDYGTPLDKARFKNGAGAGVYFFVAFIGFQFDVAYGFQSDEVHAHFSTGFRF